MRITPVVKNANTALLFFAFFRVKWLKHLEKQRTGNFPNAVDGSMMGGRKKKSIFSLFSRNSEEKSVILLAE